MAEKKRIMEEKEGVGNDRGIIERDRWWQGVSGGGVGIRLVESVRYLGEGMRREKRGRNQ